MAIEVHEGGTTFTGVHIELYRVVHIQSALALECNTGLRHSRGSVMLIANDVSVTLDHNAVEKASGVKVGKLGVKRTKRGALGDLTLWLLIVWDYQMPNTTRRALGDDLAGKIERKAARIKAKIGTSVAPVEPK